MSITLLVHESLKPEKTMPLLTKLSCPSSAHAFKCEVYSSEDLGEKHCPLCAKASKGADTNKIIPPNQLVIAHPDLEAGERTAYVASEPTVGGNTGTSKSPGESNPASDPTTIESVSEGSKRPREPIVDLEAGVVSDDAIVKKSALPSESDGILRVDEVLPNPDFIPQHMASLNSMTLLDQGDVVKKVERYVKEAETYKMCLCTDPSHPKPVLNYFPENISRCLSASEHLGHREYMLEDCGWEAPPPRSISKSAIAGFVSLYVLYVLGYTAMVLAIAAVGLALIISWTAITFVWSLFCGDLAKAESERARQEPTTHKYFEFVPQFAPPMWPESDGP